MEKTHKQEFTINLKMDGYYCNLECESLQGLITESAIKEKLKQSKFYPIVCSARCKLFNDAYINSPVITPFGVKFLRCEQCYKIYGVENE